jgi:hypothetical protein
MARFEKGKSCNPKGRPRGSRNVTSTRLRDKLDGDLDQLIEVVRDAALRGDMRAQKLIFERLLPIPKDEAIQISEALPAVNTAKDAVQFGAVILRSVAKGEITPTQANVLMQVVDVYLKACDITELSRKVEELEGMKQFIQDNLPAKRK